MTMPRRRQVDLTAITETPGNPASRGYLREIQGSVSVIWSLSCRSAFDPPAHDSRTQRRRRVANAGEGRLTLTLAILIGGLLAVSLAGRAAADEATPGAEHGHGVGSTHAAPTTESTYAAGYDPLALIRSLKPEEIAQIERGEGAGFALPAELNGLPGPRHVLDLAEDLKLTDAQIVEIAPIKAEMQTAAIAAGARYLTALAELEADLRARSVSAPDLPRRVVEISALEGELAAVHLVAHLHTADLLTEEQVAEYNRLRGYD
jgi:hypothetical protein